MRSKTTLTDEEISIFCLQMAYLLRSGAPLYDGLSAGVSDSKNKKLNIVMAQIGQSFAAHNTLEKSLRDSGSFPDYACSMVGLGEASGRLEQVFFALSSHYDKEKRIKNSLKQAVTYPLALFFIMSMVVSLLVFKVLPMFESIFSQLGGAVSQTAASMMGFGKSAGIFALIIIALLMAAAVTAIIFGKSPKGRENMEKLWLKLPFSHKILSQSAAVRFASAMSLALASGTSLDEAITTAAEITGSSLVKERINGLRPQLMSGIGMGEFLEKTGIFPLMFSRMAGIGMKTGNLDEAMGRLASIYADELEGSITGFINAVEPILVGIIALIVGMILAAVLLPLTSIMVSIG